MEQPPQSESNIFSELIALERIFHHPSNEIATADFEKLLAPDFWEVGAFGRPYTRADALRELETRHANFQPWNQRWDATGFRCQQLAADLYLLTYTLLQDYGRLTRRATIWQHASHGWHTVFHQGTIVGKAQRPHRMSNLTDRMLEFTNQWRDRNKKQMRFALVVAAVIALLLWQTVWLRLRPPLGILLLGQLGVATALFLRNQSLAASAKTELPLTELHVHSTFLEEQRFSSRLATFEYTCQFIGFVWLGYEFWSATRSLLVAILIGVVYPLTAYWGLARPRTAKRKRLLQSEEQKVLGG